MVLTYWLIFFSINVSYFSLKICCHCQKKHTTTTIINNTNLECKFHCDHIKCWIFSCGDGRVMSTDQKGCMDRNECLDLPCLNGASCINLEPKFRYRCVCLDGFWGENCELIQEGQTLKLSMGALAAILVCLLVILSEHTIQTNCLYLSLDCIHSVFQFNSNIIKWLKLYHTPMKAKQ